MGRITSAGTAAQMGWTLAVQSVRLRIFVAPVNYWVGSTIRSGVNRFFQNEFLQVK